MRNPIQVGDKVYTITNRSIINIKAFRDVGEVLSIDGGTARVRFHHTTRATIDLTDLIPVNAIFNGVNATHIGKASHFEDFELFPPGAKVMLVNPSPRHGRAMVSLGEIGTVEEYCPYGDGEEEGDDEPYLLITFPDSYGESWCGIPSDLYLVNTSNHLLKGTLDLISR